MGISSAELESKIRELLKAETVQVIDVSDGCGQAFEVVIVSDLFMGKSTLARHKMVNEALKKEISEIHAFSQKTLTCAQFAQQQKAKAN